MRTGPWVAVYMLDVSSAVLLVCSSTVGLTRLLVRSSSGGQILVGHDLAEWLGLFLVADVSSTLCLAFHLTHLTTRRIAITFGLGRSPRRPYTHCQDGW